MVASKPSFGGALSLCILCIAVGAAACSGGGHSLPNGLDGLAPDLARLEAEREGDPARSAELLWLIANDRSAARARLDAGLAIAPRDPELLLRRALLAREELALAASRRDLLSLVGSHPDSPEADAALTVLLDEGAEHPAEHPTEHPDGLSQLTGALEQAGLFEVPAPERGTRVVAAAALMAAMAHHRDDRTRLQAARARGGFITTARVVGPIAPPDDLAFETDRRFEDEDAWKSPGLFRGQPVVLRAIEAKTFRLHPALPERAGLYVLESFVNLSPAVETGPVDLVAQLPSAARLTVNGAVVLQRNQREHRGRTLHRARLRMKPGRHRVVLSILAAPGTDPFVAWIGADGRPVVDGGPPAPAAWIRSSPPSIEPAPSYNDRPFASEGLGERLARNGARAPFGQWLGAHLATGAWHGDLDRARALSEIFLENHPRSAAGWALRARVLRRMNASPTLATTALRRAAEEDPTAPRPLLGLANALAGQDPDEALELVNRARTAAPDAPEPEELAFRLFRERGWRAEAVGALSAAVQKGTKSRGLVRGARYLRDLDRHRQADALIARALSRAPRLAPAVRFEAALRNLSLPREAWPLLEDEGTPAADLRGAEVALADGDLDLAHSLTAKVLRAVPHDARARRMQLRIAALRGEQAGFSTALRALRRRGQSTVALEAQAALFGIRPRWEPQPGGWLDRALAFDPWPAVTPREPGLAAPGLDPANRWAGHSQVVLLDRVVDRVAADGSVTSLQHHVTRLQTKEATDQAGEVRLPSGALALSLKTLKTDGRVLDVDRHAGKDDVSFSALAPGDAVEQEYVVMENPRSPWGGYLRTFYFRGPAPMIRSEFVVTVPRGTPVWTRRYHGAPEPEVHREAEETIYLWRTRNVAALPKEPFSPYPEAYLPHVVVSVGLDRSTARRTNVHRLHRAARSGPPIPRLARRLTDGVPGGLGRARAIYAFVDKEVDHGPATDPVTVLETRRGDATGLFVALLRAAHIDATVVMVRPGHRPSRASPPPDPAAFSQRAARVALDDGRVMWATFDHRGSWFGGLEPRSRGARYLAVEGTAIVERAVPDSEIETWPLGSKVDLAVDASGTARGEIALTLPGRHQDGLARFVKQSRPREVDRLIQRWLGSVLSGARLVDVSASGLETRAAPLEIRVRAEIPHFMAVDDGHLIAEQVLVSPLAHRAVGLPGLSRYLVKPHRNIPLLLVPVEERMTVTIRLPPSVAGLVERPRSFARTFAHGTFEQRFTWDAASRTARWARTDRVPAARVPPAEFPVFRRRIEEVVQLGDNRLVARVKTRAPANETARSR